MKKAPELSIIVPVYNAGKYLIDCLESIIQQTFSDFEIILVNDGSQDDSGGICDAYSEKDARIKVTHQTNGGASVARKRGLEIAKGNYIGWVDADDRIEPDMYSVLYKLSKRYNADIAECQYYTVKGNLKFRSGKEEPVIFGNGDFILDQYFKAQMKPSFCNKIYKAELFDRIQFPDRQIHVDFYVNTQFALMPLRYVRTSEVKYYYFERPNSNLTTYTSREMREAIYLFDYTMLLATKVATSKKSRSYLSRDAINRLMGRYFEVSVHSRLTNQNVYNHYIRKILGYSLVGYLIRTHLPIKTKISYVLLISNMKGLQVKLHNYLGKK